MKISGGCESFVRCRWASECREKNPLYYCCYDVLVNTNVLRGLTLKMKACDSVLLLENGKVDVKWLFKLRCVASLSDATHLPAGLHVKHNKSDVFNYDIKVAGRTCARLVPSQSRGARTDARTHALAGIPV